jgi:hypothetical protein
MYKRFGLACQQLCFELERLAKIGKQGNDFMAFGLRSLGKA